MTAPTLSAMPLFKGLNRRELDHVRSLSTSLSVLPGTTLTLQGQLGQECMLVVEGDVVIERDGVPIAHAGPGDLVGEIALLTGQPSLRTATARAVSPARVLVFNQMEFATLMDDIPTVASRVQSATIHRMDQLARS
jgi:CRP-like cAMP-binding protein